jgi:hypothetical protein
MKVYMFRTVRLPIIRNFIHCTLSNGIYHATLWTASEQDQDGTAVPSWSCSEAVYEPVWHTPLLSVQWINSWWWRDELSETCRDSWQNKICEINISSWFYYKEICCDARSHERRNKVRSSFQYEPQLSASILTPFIPDITYRFQHRPFNGQGLLDVRHFYVGSRQSVIAFERY